MKNLRIAIFASGNGSNALQLSSFFKEKQSFEIAGIYTNNPLAGIIKKGEEQLLSVSLLSPEEVNNGALLTQRMLTDNIDYIILAGFLKKIPVELVQAFPNRIINIHPALLPKYGGKGMYGMHVHQAVKAANETTSGITIHLVNENYDEGKHLAQFKCEITSSDSAADIQKKVQILEHKYFAQTIFDYISSNPN